jgi:guanylate kinase
MNELRRAAEFRATLKDYTPSEAAQKMLRETPFALLVGPTSSGRNTIITELLKTGYYYHVISDTTRGMRTKDGKPIEKNGREYWFRNEDDVFAEITKGEFVEAAIIHEQQVSGMSIREIAHAHHAHRIAVTDVEPNGAATIHALNPDVHAIFVLPPSFDVWMARLHNRGGLPEDEIRRRLESAHREIGAALTQDYYTFVINLDLQYAVEDIDAIVRLHKFSAAKQREARELAEQLRRDVAAYLHPKESIFQ